MQVKYIDGVSSNEDSGNEEEEDEESGESSTVILKCHEISSQNTLKRHHKNKIP